MARFVLVHGAWHGSWCFAALVTELERRGHEAVATDLPCDVAGLTQLDYAAVVGPQPDAVVLGHSLGAQTIPHVAARLRVYLGGLLPVEDPRRECFRPEFGGTVQDGLGRSYWPYADACAACSSSISADASDRPVSRSSACTNSPPLIPIRRCTRHTDRSMPTLLSAVRHAITCWYTLSISVPSKSKRNEGVGVCG